MRRVKSLKEWAKVFLELATTRTWQKIDAVLNWYADHFGEEFVPIAYSAQAFLNKFAHFEDAIKRSKNGQASKSKSHKKEEMYFDDGGFLRHKEDKS